ncbi:aminotransferase class I/II-fold pyridoxal phosphate-dependent enzyme [Enterococcus cecorum]|uniref:aminotransferase class I/II-fold pyridoxal phosphate-dependent enzyme n=1 Tax=Enterococcus cecorum TaxID=44008 RepID=UPI003F8DCD2A
MGENIETFLAQLGNRIDEQTGAVSAPIHLSTTYSHPKFGHSTGFDYTRTKNPTRAILEEGLAKLEEGAQAIVTSSGMSAIQLVFQLFPAGSAFLVSRDLYGGSYRYFKEIERQGIAKFLYFDTEEELAAQITENISAVFIETPTNPLMREVSIKRVAEIAKSKGALTIVDNTFLTPLRQKPLTQGADLVVHSATKFLAGHNDILAGVVVAKTQELGERLLYLVNTTGPTLAAFDCWLFIRSLKTLPLRFNQQEKNAKIVVEALQNHPAVKEVFYPGVGAMVSFKIADESKVGPFLEQLKLFTYAESLGGVESLITYPTTQTHADIPEAERLAYGLTPDLLRLSIGIEDAHDLAADLTQGLSIVTRK